jgi:membrane protein YqaA with SNARE-associated domain
LSSEVRESLSLVVLFFYSFPSEFLVGLVPHEPALIYFGAFHPALVVASVASVSTVLAEAMNYSFFSYFYEKPSLRAVYRKRGVKKTVELFNRAPFSAILFAGFTPVPFFPVRFLVVMTGYSLPRYLMGVLLSRTPRFFLLAAFGSLVPIPGKLLTGLFVGMLLAVNLPTLYQVVFRNENGEGGTLGAVSVQVPEPDVEL